MPKIKSELQRGPKKQSASPPALASAREKKQVPVPVQDDVQDRSHWRDSNIPKDQRVKTHFLFERADVDEVLFQISQSDAIKLYHINKKKDLAGLEFGKA